MFDNLDEYKGIGIIIIVVGAILLHSKDLEMVLLMTGIIVNIIAICLNTGVTNFKNDSKPPNTYVPPRRYDLVQKQLTKEGLSSDIPEYANITEGYETLLPYLDKTKYEKRIPNYNKKEDSQEKRSEDRPFATYRKETMDNYKGAVDFSKDEMYAETAMDMAANSGIKRPGVNYQRQVAGAMNRRQVVQPVVGAELEDEEMKPWWGAFDV